MGILNGGKFMKGKELNVDTSAVELNRVEITSPLLANCCLLTADC
jgi:hypothetical protein